MKMTKALFHNHYNTTRVPFLQKNLDPGTKDLLVLLFLSRSRVVYKAVNIYIYICIKYLTIHNIAIAYGLGP